MCLQRLGKRGLFAEEFRVNGGSNTIEDGERSDVGRNLMTKAWPPIAFAEPGRMSEVVTPPDIERRYFLTLEPFFRDLTSLQHRRGY